MREVTTAVRKEVYLSRIRQISLELGGYEIACYCKTKWWLYADEYQIQQIQPKMCFDQKFLEETTNMLTWGEGETLKPMYLTNWLYYFSPQLEVSVVFAQPPSSVIFIEKRLFWDTTATVAHLTRETCKVQGHVLTYFYKLNPYVYIPAIGAGLLTSSKTHSPGTDGWQE